MTIIQKGEPMNDLISRQAAIDAIGEKSDEIYKTKQKGATYPHDDFFQGMAYTEDVVKQLPPALEPLTDKEQRIFLAAIERERKVCKEVDDQYTHEPYEVLLTKVCSEIERKVKAALWS